MSLLLKLSFKPHTLCEMIFKLAMMIKTKQKKNAKKYELEGHLNNNCEGEIGELPFSLK